MARPPRLPKLLAALQAQQGGTVSGPPRDPWHAILWDNVVYLTDEGRRDQAFAALKQTVGLDARTIAAAPDELLLPICGKGKMAHDRVLALRECAEQFATAGDPRQLVRRPEPEARKGLKQFPGVGDPGADRLLLFAGQATPVALESNGLRTLLRLGYGKEASNYAASYRSATTAAAAELPDEVEPRVDAYLRLRRHGQEVCRRQPFCDRCVLANHCPTARGDDMH
ncbi:MAG TPA: hypothetical protein VK348_12995 [Planctomycetota bacterium]|nr:hypothetical protein [Planctomycetota bacterium]